MGFIFSENHKTTSEVGKSLFDFADSLKIRVPTSCARNGECHECIVQVSDNHNILSPKTESEIFLGDGYRLACQANITSDQKDLSFNVLRRQPKILESGIKRKYNFSPLTYIKNNNVISSSSGKELILSQNLTPIFGIACDIGTTTIELLNENLSIFYSWIINVKTGQSVKCNSPSRKKQMRIEKKTEKNGSLLLLLRLLKVFEWSMGLKQWEICLFCI